MASIGALGAFDLGSSPGRATIFLKENVEIVVCVGTDKAVSPLNTYGATKHLMEKLFVTASNHINPAKHRTKFLAVRYGNVLEYSSNNVDILTKDEMITILNQEIFNK